MINLAFYRAYWCAQQTDTRTTKRATSVAKGPIYTMQVVRLIIHVYVHVYGIIIYLAAIIHIDRIQLTNFKVP